MTSAERRYIQTFWERAVAGKRLPVIVATPDRSGAAPADCAWQAYYDGREEVGPYGFGPTEEAARSDLIENYDIPGAA